MNCRINKVYKSTENSVRWSEYNAWLTNAKSEGQEMPQRNFGLNIKPYASSIDDQLAAKGMERMANLQKMAKMGCWEIEYGQDGLPISESVEWSDEVFRIYGYLPNEVNPTTELFYSHVHPEDLDTMNRAITKGLEEKKSFNVGHRAVCKNGTVKYLNQRGEFIFNEDGKPIGMMGITQDLTEKRNNILELQQAQSNFRNILENTDTGYVLIDKEYMVLSFNEKANEFLESGTEFTLAIGGDYFDIIREERKEAVKVAITEILETQQPLHYEVQYPSLDGEERWVKIRMFPIYNGDQEILGLTIAIDDVSEQKKWMMEKEEMTNRLIQRNNDLEQFAFIVSHNLRAPLANIIGLSKMIPEMDPQNESFGEFLGGLEQSAERLDHVVSDLNTILQVRNTLKESKVAISLQQLFDEVMADVPEAQQNDAAKITADFSRVHEILGVKPYMVSIFTNLITNSIKYKKPNEPLELHIMASKQGGNVILEFKDNGLGIDMEKHGKDIFKLYKRFHAGVDGKGMGLYMVNSQVTSLGGNIKVESRMGRGTTFTISLPA